MQSLHEIENYNIHSVMLGTYQRTSHTTLVFIFFLYKLSTDPLSDTYKIKLFFQEVNWRKNKLGKLTKNRGNVQIQSNFSNSLNACRFYDIDERTTTESMYIKNQDVLTRSSSYTTIIFVGAWDGQFYICRLATKQKIFETFNLNTSVSRRFREKNLHFLSQLSFIKFLVYDF